MKILCISNYYPPYFEGGYEISVKETMDYMNEQSHEVYILCGIKGIDNPSEEIGSIKPNKPLRILRYIDYLNGSFFDKHRVEVFNYRITKSLIQQLHPDIVYLGNMKALSISPVIAIQHLKQPHVFDLGDIWLRTYVTSGFKSRLFRIMKQVLPFTIGGKIHLEPVIVLSKWMESQVAERYGSKEIYVIPRGIRIPEDNPRVLTKPIKYIFAGRIEPLKGLDIIIRALSQILQEKPGFEFTLDIYGEEDPEYGEACRKLIQDLHLDSHFHFMGKSLKLQSIFPDYDVMLMPTLAEEAFGRVIIEAMAQRLIVIATDAYGPKEIISNGSDGFLFERCSSAALAEKIMKLELLPFDEIETIRNQARLKIINNYEISLVKKKIEVILYKILQARNG